MKKHYFLSVVIGMLLLESAGCASAEQTKQCSSVPSPGSICKPVVQLVKKQEASLAQVDPPLEAADPYLMQLPYLGDPKQCRMNGQVANAYADALEQLPAELYDPQYEYRGKLVAGFVDIGNDGIPFLFTAYEDVTPRSPNLLNWVDGQKYFMARVLYNSGQNMLNLWTIEDGKAIPVELIKGSPSDMMCCRIEGKAGLRVEQGSCEKLGDTQKIVYYIASSGKLHRIHEVERYTAFALTEDMAKGEELPGGGRSTYYDDGDGGYSFGGQSADIADLLTYGWKQEPSDEVGIDGLYLTMIDGQKMDDPHIVPDWEKRMVIDTNRRFVSNKDGWSMFAIDHMDAGEVIRILRQYANRTSSSVSPD